jgi:hypothetical protein
MQAEISRSRPAEVEFPHFDHEDSSLAAQQPRCELVGISSLTWRPVVLSQRRAVCCLRIWRPGAVSICTPVELHPGHPVNEIVSLPNERPRAHTGEWIRKSSKRPDVRMSTAVERRNSLAVIATWSEIGPSAADEISGGLTKLPADVFIQELRPADFAAFAEGTLLDPRVLIGGTIVWVSCPKMWRCIA